MKQMTLAADRGFETHARATRTRGLIYCVYCNLHPLLNRLGVAARLVIELRIKTNKDGLLCGKRNV
jgi:hypothetical protein